MTSPTTTQKETAVTNTAVQQLSRIFPRARLQLLATAFVLFAFFIGLFAYVQFGTDALAGNDGYYHIKMGYLIRQEGLKPDFPWLPLTILNQRDFYDHHLLYHAFLALFAVTDPAVDGGAALTQSAKIASVILPALAFLAIWWLLRGQGVRWPELWALGLFAVSQAFLYRMSMPRAQSASLLILALGLHWLFKERYWLLIPLGFVYVWTYNAFPLLLVMGGVYLVAILLTEQKFAWQAVVFPAVGIGLGLLINPYFPENISFIINHLLPKIGESETRVGNEWYPYRTWTLVQNSGFALLAAVAGALKKFGLAGTVDVAVTRNEAARMKPDGDGIRRAMAALGAAAPRTLMVGDSMSDLGAARDAGVAVAILAGGESSPAEIAAGGPDHQFRSLAEVADLL